MYLITLEEILKEREELLEKQKKLQELVKKIDSESVVPFDLNKFYKFSQEQVLEATSQEYRAFLREAHYGNLYNGQYLYLGDGNLFIEKELMMVTSKLVQFCELLDISILKSRTRLVGINHRDSAKLLSSLGFLPLITQQLMYTLFIPFLDANQDSERTLIEMNDGIGELLADLYNGDDQIIAEARRKVNLPGNTYFLRDDLDSFGIPKDVKKPGGRHFFSNYLRGRYDAVAFRMNNFELGLHIYLDASFGSPRLGIRRVKIIPH